MLSLLLTSTFLLSAQEPNLLSWGEQQLIDYEAAFVEGRKQQARDILDNGLDRLADAALDTLIGKFYNLYTYWYYDAGKLDSALIMQVQAFRYFERGFGEGEPTAFAAHNSAFLFQRVLGQADSAIYYYQRGLAIYKKLDRPLDVADEYRNIGQVHLSQNRYAAAQRAYLSALEVLKEVDEATFECMVQSHQILYAKTQAWLYLNLADLKAELDDIRQVRVYLQYAQDILEHYAERFPELQQEVRENQARLYDYAGLYELSIREYQFLLDSIGLDRSMDSVRIRSRLLSLYQDSEQYALAIKMGEELRRSAQQGQGSTARRDIKNLWMLAEVYLANQQLDKASAIEQEAAALVFALDHSLQYAQQYILRARILRAQGDYVRSQEALELATQVHQFPPSTALADLESLKSDVAFQLYRDTDQAPLLDTAAFWARKSWRTLVDYESQTFRRRSFGENYRQPTETILQVLFERQRLRPSSDGVQEILSYMEVGRGQSLKLGREWQWGRRSQSDQYERLRRRYLSFLKQRLSLEKQAPAGAQIHAINDSLVQLGRTLDQLKPSLQLESAPQLDALQEVLPNDQSAVLVYYAGAHHWYGLGISPDTVILFQKALTETLRTQLRQFKSASRNLGASVNTLSATSFTLYQTLLAPILEQLPNDLARLYISADGELSDLPWPALCTSRAESEDFRQWPFLVHQYSLICVPHVADLLPRPQLPSEPLSVACFAPQYPERIDTSTQYKLSSLYRSGYWALPGAQEEAQRIQALYGSRADVYADKSLDAGFFTERAKSYSVLHLAMHAVADAAYPDESYLLFPGQDGQMEYLTALDLLIMGMDVDLMILSACYAGDGPWQAGDGVLSLAYALRQAGVATVVSNYWATSDQLSKDLMVEFHRQLINGESRDQALQQAQQQYLRSLPLAQAAHPFYWAGFHIQGRLTPLDPSNDRWYWWWGALLIFLLAGYWIWRRSSAARS